MNLYFLIGSNVVAFYDDCFGLPVFPYNCGINLSIENILNMLKIKVGNN